MNQQVTIKGKTYDLEDTADLVSIQNQLVPDNWKLSRAACVKLIIRLGVMLSFQFLRHWYANARMIIKAALDEGEGGGKAEQTVSFTFKIDVTAPQVAAITALKMGGTMKFGTTGTPQTSDLTQSELPLDSDLSKAFDTGSLAAEAAAAHEKDTPPEQTEPPTGEPGAEPPTNVIKIDAGKKKREKVEKK
jgi:hypothetical protein